MLADTDQSPIAQGYEYDSTGMKPDTNVILVNNRRERELATLT